MKKYGLLALAAVIPAFAQSSNASGATATTSGTTTTTGNATSSAGGNAAGDWAALVALTAPPHLSFPAGTKVTPAMVAAQRRQFALQFRTAAKAAKNFYTQYSSDVNAAAARKIEAVQSLTGVVDDDAQYETAAQAIATAFRHDAANPASDRFEVALLSERVAARTALAGAPFVNHTATLEGIAGKLRTEFGDLPDVYAFYDSVARTADSVSATRIATSLKQWPASPAVRADAQMMLTRAAMTGKPLDWSLKRTDGTMLPLNVQTGKITVLYAWFPNGSTSGVQVLNPLKAAFPADAQMIYLALGANPTQAQAATARAPISGIVCYEPAGTRGPTAAKLLLQSTPYAFVLGRNGMLSGFGPISEIQNLLAGAK